MRGHGMAPPPPTCFSPVGGPPSPPCVQMVVTWNSFFPSEVPTSTSHFVNKVIRFVLLDLGSRGGWIRERIGFSRHFPSIGGGSNSTGMYFFPLDSSHSKRRWWNTLLGQRKQSTSDRSIFVCCARLFLPPYERTTTTWYVRGLQLQAVHTV